MKQTKPAIHELDMNELEELLRRVDANELNAEDGKASGRWPYRTST